MEIYIYIYIHIWIYIYIYIHICIKHSKGNPTSRRIDKNRTQAPAFGHANGQRNCHSSRSCNVVEPPWHELRGSRNRQTSLKMWTRINDDQRAKNYRFVWFSTAVIAGLCWDVRIDTVTCRRICATKIHQQIVAQTARPNCWWVVSVLFIFLSVSLSFSLFLVFSPTEMPTRICI